MDDVVRHLRRSNELSDSPLDNFEERQARLVHELNHRVKNTLAMVQAIVIQTLSGAAIPDNTRRALEQRLIALARAHDVLTRECWGGAELGEIIAAVLMLDEAQWGQRIRAQGPPVRLRPQTAVSLALVLNELAMNAIRHGALSAPRGRINIEWTACPVEDGFQVNLTWLEREGAPVEPPARPGFGTRFITRSLASERGSATLAYPLEGLRCEISLLVSSCAAAAELQTA